VTARHRGLLAAGAVAAAALLGIAALLPPAALRLDARPRDARTIAGAVHVHTDRSDGTGTIDEVAAAAARAGLQFVVVTDHGDGTREPDAPAYRHGVLCLDAVEISTTGGHYLAIGLPRAPYRLAGEPRDVVDDVRRLGGVGIVAHAASPKDDLRWRAWETAFDGIEWLNADSEWRDEGGWAVARALLAYFLRKPETIAAMFDRPDEPLAAWDRAARERRVIGTAGHDAHARIGLAGNWEPGEHDVSLRLPSYEAAFRTFALRVRLAAPPSGDAAADAAALVAAIRAGHMYTAIDALAAPPDLSFVATAPGGGAEAGDQLRVETAVQLDARVPPAPGVSLVLLRDGATVHAETGPVLSYRHEARDARAVYRVEARLQGAPGRPAVPWIVSNPIVIGPPRADPWPDPAPLPAAAVRPLAGEAWHVEHDPRSRAAVLAVGGADAGAVRLEYAIAGGERHGQYAAAVTTLAMGALAGWDRLAFTARASGPMRISVQVRAPESGARWLRSVYVDQQPRPVHVRFDDMRPAEPGTPAAVPLDALDSVLFVVDTTHTPPGREGSLALEAVRLERAGERQVRTVSSR
jgi:hypothetical protein